MSQWNQQPAWIEASTAEAGERERAFFRSVYTWMFGGLLVTTVAALWVATSPAMQQLVLGNRMVFFGLLIAELAIVFYASYALPRLSPAAAATLFLVYSLFTGLTISVIIFLYTASSVFMAFAISGGMFAAMSVYGRVTKKDLTGWGSFLFMGLIGIILASVANFFFKSGPLDMAISTIAVFIFVGLTAYKTQALKHMAQTSTGSMETLAIYGALTLYITFINLFLNILRLFGSRRN